MLAKEIQRGGKMKRKFSKAMGIGLVLVLLISLLPIILLSGCAEGGGIDFVQIVNNPFVVIVAAVVLALWMFKRNK